MKISGKFFENHASLEYSKLAKHDPPITLLSLDTTELICCLDVQ